MAITYKIEQMDSYLSVTTSGFTESKEEHLAYAKAAYEAMLDSKGSRILVDEREMEYRLGTIDIFQLGEEVAKTAGVPMMVAVVTNPDNSEDADFFQNIVRNRGLMLRYFKTTEAAREWLVS